MPAVILPKSQGASEVAGTVTSEVATVPALSEYVTGSVAELCLGMTESASHKSNKPPASAIERLKS